MQVKKKKIVTKVWRKKAPKMSVQERVTNNQYRAYKASQRRELPQRPKRVRKQRYGGGGVVAEIMQHDRREEKELKQVVRAIRSKDDGFRSKAKINSNGLRVGQAPFHETYGYGERWFIRHTQFTIGRSGTSPYNVDNRVIQFTVGTSSQYAQSIHFGSIYGVSEDGGSGMQVGWAASGYTQPSTASTLISPVANVVTSGLKFFQAAAFRGARIRYVPSVSKMVAGQLVFAGKYVDSLATSIDETTFADIASLPSSTTVQVSDTCDFRVFPTARLNEPAMQFTASPGIGTGNNYWSLLVAVDSPLATATTDVLGHLELDIIYDCYGKQWVSDEVKSGTSLTAEEKKVSDILKKLREYDLKELSDAKEVKQKPLEMRALGEHKDLDDDDWQKIQQADSRQKICDLKAYRESLKAAQNACPQSASTSSVTSAVAPNVQSRTPKI